MEEGKMFLKRLFSTVVLLGVFSAVIFSPSPWNNIAFFLLSVLLTYTLVMEICGIVKNLGMETFKHLTSLFCVLIVIVANLEYFLVDSDLTSVLYNILLFAIAIGCPIFILFSKNSGEKIKKMFNSMAISIFVLIPVLLIVGIFISGIEASDPTHNFNSYFLVFILLTKIGDIGAYVVGTISNKLMKNGNHKMIPSISPSKSWEGAAGGLIFTLLLAFGFHCWIPELVVVETVPLTIIMGSCMFFGSMGGDLMESALKRAAGVKDSGNAIPGIGGVFDLVDSLFVTAPVAAVIFASI